MGRTNDAYAVANGHPPVARGVICVDFDATLFPWGKTLLSDDDPFEGAAETLRAFKEAGLTIVILTSRMSRSWHEHEGFSDDEVAEQYEYVHKRLERHNIPFDRITAEKVPAIAYIDDKAIEFKPDENNWEEIRERILRVWA
jgi:hydroxymethylpyrimidine pyrophosphatase-like HAD family hydrolase